MLNMRFIFLLLCASISLSSLAQVEVMYPHRYDELPAYKDGTDALLARIKRGIRYPEAERVFRIQGTGQIRFMVDDEGVIRNISVPKSVSAALDAEAKRVIEELAGWKPGKRKGKAQLSYVTLNVPFFLSPPKPETISVKGYKDPVYLDTEPMPEFQGGFSAMLGYFQDASPFPPEAQEISCPELTFSFIVGKDGKVGAAQIANCEDKELSRKILESLKAMPAWIPGTFESRQVPVKITLPLNVFLKS